MGFGKKCILQILGVLRDHLADSLMGGPIARGSVKVGFQTVVQVWSGEQIPPPHFNLNLASTYINFTSVSPQFAYLEPLSSGGGRGAVGKCTGPK